MASNQTPSTSASLPTALGEARISCHINTITNALLEIALKWGRASLVEKEKLEFQDNIDLRLENEIEGPLVGIMALRGFFSTSDQPNGWQETAEAVKMLSTMLQKDIEGVRKGYGIKSEGRAEEKVAKQ